MNIKEIHVKSVLTKSNLPASAYCINPYIGCQHGCVYCYARFMKRFTKHTEPWGSFVDIKVNSPEILKKQLSKNPKKSTALIGSVTDAYQPIEKRYGITRKLLEIIVDHQFPVSILTKSNLVLRDIDLLSKLDDCDVGITVTSLDDEFRKRFEPFTSSISDRINCLKSLHEIGIKTYVFIGPIFPQIVDVAEIIEGVSDYSDSVMAESLNINCGNWADTKAVLDKYYPEISTSYKQLISNVSTWQSIEKLVNLECKKSGIQFGGYFCH